MCDGNTGFPINVEGGTQRPTIRSRAWCGLPNLGRHTHIAAYIMLRFIPVLWRPAGTRVMSEIALFRAVVLRALSDATRADGGGRDALQERSHAQEWLLSGSRDFRGGCRLAVLFIALASVTFAPPPAYAAEAPLFQFEREAKRHCPDDTVVWLNAQRASTTSKGSGGTATPSKGRSCARRKRRAAPPRTGDSYRRRHPATTSGPPRVHYWWTRMLAER